MQKWDYFRRVTKGSLFGNPSLAGVRMPVTQRHKIQGGPLVILLEVIKASVANKQCTEFRWHDTKMEGRTKEGDLFFRKNWSGRTIFTGTNIPVTVLL